MADHIMPTASITIKGTTAVYDSSSWWADNLTVTTEPERVVVMLSTDENINLVVVGGYDVRAALRGAGNGNAVAEGDGEALRQGSGNGNAVARGDGQAVRQGSGNGNAVAHGDGQAVRQGNGDGDAICHGRGEALRSGEGLGRAIQMFSN